jgi:hypothetical protein
MSKSTIDFAALKIATKTIENKYENCFRLDYNINGECGKILLNKPRQQLIDEGKLTIIEPLEWTLTDDQFLLQTTFTLVAKSSGRKASLNAFIYTLNDDTITYTEHECEVEGTPK